MAREKNKITLEKDTPQHGDIKVATQIINDLSSGIYSSPATCIKELINNSFDADAHLVTIRIKPVEDTITIIDDGLGMNALDFDENFAWISKSNKRNDGLYSPSGRPLIGKIGIGFIAVNEICDSLEISSTKKGEDIKFTATIDFEQYNSTPTNVDDGLIKAGFELVNEDEKKDSHYTAIRLVGLKEGVREILADKQYLSKLKATKNKSYSKSSFKSMRDMLHQHFEKGLRSFSADNAYVQFLINLASYVPVEYMEGGPIEGASKDKVINELIERHKSFQFKVDVDGIYLKKPILLGVSKKLKSKYSSFSKNILVGKGYLRFSGYFYTQNRLLIPRELNGVSVKIKNVPIAPRFGYDTSLMGYPNYMNQLLSNWISGEIYVDEGLEDAMNIDRQSFRETHPEYMKLQTFVHEFLSQDFFPKVVLPLYKEGRVKREKKKQSEEHGALEKLLGTKEVLIEEVDSDGQVNGDNPPVSIRQRSSRRTVIEVNKQFTRGIKKTEWNYLEKVLVIFEASVRASNGNIKKLKDIFYKSVSAWLKDKE